MRSWTSNTAGKGIAGENSILSAIIHMTSDRRGLDVKWKQLRRGKVLRLSGRWADDMCPISCK
jgi:hypothetical protein